MLNRVFIAYSPLNLLVAVQQRSKDDLRVLQELFSDQAQSTYGTGVQNRRRSICGGEGPGEVRAIHLLLTTHSGGQSFLPCGRHPVMENRTALNS